MTVAQRVGQLFLVGIADAPRSEVARAVAAYHFGSLLFGTTSSASQSEIRQVTAADQSAGYLVPDHGTGFPAGNVADPARYHRQAWPGRDR